MKTTMIKFICQWGERSAEVSGEVDSNFSGYGNVFLITGVTVILSPGVTIVPEPLYLPRLIVHTHLLRSPIQKWYIPVDGIGKE